MWAEPSEGDASGPVDQNRFRTSTNAVVPMPSTVRSYALLAVRVVLVSGGLLGAALTVYTLATMPPAEPDEGFVTGLAYFFGSIIFVLAAGAASLGVVLPTLVGADDPIGFNRWQRLLLKAAATLVGGGFLLGLAYGLATELQYGFFLWLATIALGVVLVCVAVGWRVVEAVVGALLELGSGVA